MGGFIITDATPQSLRVPKAVAQWVPTTFRGFIRANADGSIPNVVMRAHGANFADQWGGTGGTPAIPRLNNPADIDRIDLYDQHGTLVHSFGGLAVDEGAELTIPGTLLGLGAWHLRNRLTDGSASEDTIWGLEQGDGSFVVVPHSLDTLPAVGTSPSGRFGEIDSPLWAALGMPTRATIKMHAVEGGVAVPVSDWRGGAHSVLSALSAWVGEDTARTRPDGAPRKLRILSVSDFTVGDGTALAAEIANSAYDNVDLILSTNEIKPDNGHENGVLSASNLALVQEFRTAVKGVRPGWLIGSPSSVKLTAAAVTSINGYLAAAAATGSPNAPFFDVLMLHDYPGSTGTPGYAREYYGRVSELAWFGPVFIDEGAGNAAAQEGGGYDNRQARRTLWDLRARSAYGHIPPEWTCYFSGFNNFPWWIAYQAVPTSEPTPYQAVGRFAVHKLARTGLSQFPAAALHHPDGDEDELLCVALYRATTGGAQPAPATNRAMVDIQALGDPDASITFAVTGPVGTSLEVWNADGLSVQAPVTSGRVTIDRTLLAHPEGLTAGAFLFLPSGGCSATIVNTAPAPKIAGDRINLASSHGSSSAPITRITRGAWLNNLTEDDGNYGGPTSIWLTNTILSTPQRLTLTFRDGPQRVHRLTLVSGAPWQLQSALSEFRILGVAGDTETELQHVTVSRVVADWRTMSRQSWHRSFDKDAFVWRIDLATPQVVDSLIVEAIAATYGGSPTLNAATGFGRTTTESDSGPVDVTTWTGSNLLGAGFAGPQRFEVQRAWVHASPAAGVPTGTPRYLVRAS